MYIANWENELLRELNPVFELPEGDFSYSKILKLNETEKEKIQKQYEQALKDRKLLNKGSSGKSGKYIKKSGYNNIINLNPLYNNVKSALAFRIGCFFPHLHMEELKNGTVRVKCYKSTPLNIANLYNTHFLRLVSIFWCVIEKYINDHIVENPENKAFIDKYSKKLNQIYNQMIAQQHFECVFQDIDHIYDEMPTKKEAFYEYFKKYNVNLIPIKILAKGQEYQRPQKRFDHYEKVFSNLQNSNFEFRYFLQLLLDSTDLYESFSKKNYYLEDIF